MFKSIPHGGELVNRTVSGDAREAVLQRATDLKKVELSEVSIADLEMISNGAMSPLTGFMKQADYESVVENMRLSNGLVWSLPITLPVSRETADEIEVGEEIALVEPNGDKLVLATMTVEEKYTYDKRREAEKVYKTAEEAHPGAVRVLKQGDVYLGGDVTVVNAPSNATFLESRRTPAQTRAAFEELGWKSVVGFQTRNPIHRAHEYIQKAALEIVDGLLLHPLVGETKSDDISAAIRMKSYDVLLEKYFPEGRVLLSVFPAAMRYAGPREAIFHAICRKNYGCTHFIVGRDHAGVGSYYGTYEAQEVMSQFTYEELGIVPLNFEHAFYCKRTLGMATTKTSPAAPEERVFLSGTKVREMLRAGEVPPAEFTRAEVAQVLIEGMKENE